MRACTVIAAAELPFARVLAASLGAVRLTALVIDDPAALRREDEPFELVRPQHLDGVEPWRLFGRGLPEVRRFLQPPLLPHLPEPALLLPPDVPLPGPLDPLPAGGVALRAPV